MDVMCTCEISCRIAIAGLHVAYMFETPTTQVWKRLHEQHQLTPVQDAFWQPKPPVELYDLAHDRDEVDNLAGKPEHAEIDASFATRASVDARSPRRRVLARGRDSARHSARLRSTWDTTKRVIPWNGYSTRPTWHRT